jgi:hypothetical protein
MKKQTKRRAYRKHSVLIRNKYIPVKDWYRENLNLFERIIGIPTSEQIGNVLIRQGYNRIENETEVIYRK